MTGRGNDDKVTKAKNVLTGSMIGMMIVIASYAISSFLFNRIQGGVQEKGICALATEIPAGAPDCGTITCTDFDNNKDGCDAQQGCCGWTKLN